MGAKKFGLDQNALSGLDDALPEKPRKRGREQEAVAEDGRAARSANLWTGQVGPSARLEGAVVYLVTLLRAEPRGGRGGARGGRDTRGRGGGRGGGNWGGGC